MTRSILWTCVVALAACGGSDEGTPLEPPPEKGPEVLDPFDTLAHFSFPGDQEQVVVLNEDLDTINPSILTWVSDTPGIVSVSSSGLMTAHAEGYARVTVSFESLSVGIAATVHDLTGVPGKIAYQAWGTDGQGSSIYVMTPRGRDPPRALTSSLPADLSPALSVDGTRVVFVRDTQGQDSLMWVSAAGGVPSLVTTSLDIQFPDWSPDGTRIAYCTNIGGQFTINLIDVDGANHEQIGGGCSPAWSPDGARIATEMPLSVMDLDGSNRVSFPEGGAQPAWSPDGSRVAYSYFGSIHTSDPDGTNVVVVTSPPSDGQGGVEWANLWPTWSPDGTRIAYTSSRPRKNQGEWEFSPDLDTWVVYADGRLPVRISRHLHLDAYPDWSN